MSTYTILDYPADKLPKDYLGYVYSKWLRSLRHGNDYFKLITQAAYYTTYHRYLTSVLEKTGTVVRLAVLTEDKDVLLGFSVYRGTVLDYVYVQRDQRRMGIGMHLVPNGVVEFTHVTKTGISILGNSYSHWRFNPFA